MGMRRVETNSSDEASIMYEPVLATDQAATSGADAQDDSDAGR
jgi:hypothetical protein